MFHRHKVGNSPRKQKNAWHSTYGEGGKNPEEVAHGLAEVQGNAAQPRCNDEPQVNAIPTK